MPLPAVRPCLPEISCCMWAKLPATLLEHEDLRLKALLGLGLIIVFQSIDLAPEGEELLVDDGGWVSRGLMREGAGEVLEVVGGAVLAVLGGKVPFIEVFPVICPCVDIYEEIVLFLEKVRTKGRLGGRELCHLVVIN